jgi:VWFA-related protein
MLHSRRSILFLLVFVPVFCFAQQPQEPRPTGANDQERIRVFTEEVIFPVRVTDSHGRFDPTLSKDELLILEDGQPQEILSVRHLPANVLLLIGTTGELNPAMKSSVSKDLALHLVSRLGGDNQIAVLQYGRDVETLQNWTADRDQTLEIIQSKLSSIRGAHLANALASTVSYFKDTPQGNRHLVLITDGVEQSEEGPSVLQGAIENLLTQGVTVHVLSYSQMGRKMMWKSQPLVLVTGRKPRKSASDIAKEILDPTNPRNEKPKIHLIIDTDIQMRMRRAEYLKAMKEGDKWLTSLATETGGTMSAPGSVSELMQQAETIANTIDSQYVVTYKPKRPFAGETKGEYRRLDVAPRRVGLTVSSRRGYVAPVVPN